MTEDFISRPRTWVRGQGHSYLSSWHFEDADNSSRTHHCIFLVYIYICHFIYHCFAVVDLRHNSCQQHAFWTNQHCLE